MTEDELLTWTMRVDSRLRDAVAELIRERDVLRAENRRSREAFARWLGKDLHSNWEGFVLEAINDRERQAVVLGRELTRIKAELSNLGERLEDTFRGGYSDPRDVEVFRHGMGTAATCVAAVLRGERNQAPDIRSERRETLE